MMSRKIDSLDVTYKQKKEDKKTISKIDDVFNIETRHAIIMAIDTFGSSNIKKLASFLGKNDATIYYHIKELLKEPALLEIDQEITNNQKGIFYKLTNLAIKYFTEPPVDKMDELFTQLYDLITTKSDQEVANFYFELMAKNPDLGKTADRDRRRFAYNHILENFMINNIEREEQLILQGNKPLNKKYPIGSLFLNSIDMKITHPRQFFEVIRIFTEMMKKLGELKVKYQNEINEKSIPPNEQINLRCHVVGGEIAEFDFDKK